MASHLTTTAYASDLTFEAERIDDGKYRVAWHDGRGLHGGLTGLARRQFVQLYEAMSEALRADVPRLPARDCAGVSAAEMAAYGCEPPFDDAVDLGKAAREGA